MFLPGGLDRERDRQSRGLSLFDLNLPNNPEGTGETPLLDLFSDSPPALARTRVLLCDHPVLISFGRISVLAVLSCFVFTGPGKGDLCGAFTW